jgi:hypothetical protein
MVFLSAFIGGETIQIRAGAQGEWCDLQAFRRDLQMGGTNGDPGRRAPIHLTFH